MSNYRPKQYYNLATSIASIVEATKKFVVYFRAKGKLSQINVDLPVGTPDAHAEAVLAVKESLVASREGYDMPVLVLLQGGKTKPVVTLEPECA